MKLDEKEDVSVGRRRRRGSDSRTILVATFGWEFDA